MQNTQALIVGDCPEFLAPQASAYQCLSAAPETGFYLAQNAQGIWALHHAKQKPIHIDFSSAHYRHRGGTEYLPKAFKGMTGGKIIDATAGWARDAWLLAYRGFHLSLYERNPYLYALLKQGITHAQHTALTADVAQRLTLTYADSSTMLLSAHEQCDAIYLDPMYPPRQKSAKVKKEMQILHSLLGAEASEKSDTSALLNSALQSHCARIVVKRPAHAPYLGNIPPHHSLEAPNTRFDIYLPKRS